MKGVIKAVIRKREGQNGGYFFVLGEDGQDRFAHASNILPPTSFDALREAQPVEFEAIEIPGKGLRADRVKVL